MGFGGIVLGPRDLERLRRRFDMTAEAFLARYAVLHNGKHKIRTGPDGNCLFFKAQRGCSVHDDKPDVCRAWPFFRGNLVDPVSLAMAKDYCSGIRRDATHAEFVAEGKAWLDQCGLRADDPAREANALLSAKDPEHT